jgi:hypothetical protein
VIATAAEVVVAPSSSRATAVMEYAPAATFVHEIENGLDVSDPIDWPLAKKFTAATVPSVSDALALIVIVAGAVNVAPLVGLVMATIGDALLALLTVTVAVAELPVAPVSSVATAERLYVPAGTLLHVIE